MRVVAPGAGRERVVLYLHGGAYQIGSAATLRHMIALISDAASAHVLSVDYRLAPEHPFPAAVEDALAAYRWLLAGGTHPGTIALAGDSASGSTRFAARARDQGVEVTIEIWDEMPHVWHAFAALLPEADRAIERVGSWLAERIPPP